jgi:hypothetical protein
LKDLQAVILAAVLLFPVALGAGGKDVVSSLTDDPGAAHLTLNFKTSPGFEATANSGDLELVTYAQSVFGKRTKRHANCSLWAWRA